MLKRFLLVLLFVTSLVAFSQANIKIGSGVLKTKKLSKRNIGFQNFNTKLKLDKYQVMKFSKIPTAKERKQLKRSGVTLLNYLQDNLFYVSVRSTSKMQGMHFSSVKIINTFTIDPLWKIHPKVYSKHIPSHAKIAPGIASLEVQYFEGGIPSDIIKLVKKLKGRVLNHQNTFRIITISLPVTKVIELATNTSVKWIEFSAPLSKRFNLIGRSSSRISVLNGLNLGGHSLYGEGMTVGLWDDDIQSHPDFGDRLVSMEFESNDTHGQHVAGTFVGSGVLDPRAKGMAPKAKFLAWNYNLQSNGLSTGQEMLKSVKEYGMSITQNSYGGYKDDNLCRTPGSYDVTSMQMDLLTNIYPKLSHVFAVGNDQATCEQITGTRYFTSEQRAKNPIYVGAVDKNGHMSDFSSWGPSDDGRLLPHITAVGVDTYSTSYDNSYEVNSGTSMATPVVSGAITLLYQRYKQMFGEDPMASLAKAAILNTAIDRGNKGVDFQYGYGLLDAEKAVDIIESKQFFVDQLSQDQKKSHTIQVPAGTKELRVMLVWTDKHGTANNKALINDLDLKVSGGGKKYLPWVLDHKKPSALALRNIDRLNNQEQVTIANPKTGTYTVEVNGFAIPEDKQSYSIVYQFVKDELKIIYPNGSEKLSPGDKAVAVWSTSGYKGNQSLEISYDAGVSYTLLADKIPATKNTYTFTVPDAQTNKARIRVVHGATADQSDQSFTIMSQPKNIKVVSEDSCGLSNTLSWDKVTGAVTYHILRADVVDASFTKVGESKTNSFKITDASKSVQNIYTVTAINSDGVESERGIAVIVDTSKKLELISTELPFEENFSSFPSEFLKVNKGDKSKYSYQPTVFSSDKSHLFTVSSVNGSSWKQGGDVFKNNPSYLTSLNLCELDASNYDGELWLKLSSVIKAGFNGVAKFRVLIDGKEVKSMNGNYVIDQLNKEGEEIFWDLTDTLVGATKSLEIQILTKEPQDIVSIGNIKLFKPDNDVAITIQVPQASSDLTDHEEVKVTLKNNSSKNVFNIPVMYQLGDNDKVEETVIDVIKPLQEFTYTFKRKLDLSEVDKMWIIKTFVDYQGDTNSKNNIDEAVTTHYGDYHLMPSVGYGSVPIIAKTKARGFTDPQGKVMNYSDNILGNVKIKPETYGMKSKIKILNFDLEDGYDKLIIRNGGKPSSPVLYELTGNNLKLPLEIISTDLLGQLYVEFISDSETNAKGWYAEISEVPDPRLADTNTFSISNFPMYDGDYSSPKSVQCEVKNNSKVTKNNVKVSYRVDKKDWVSGVIKSIPAGESVKYEFDTKVKIPAETVFNIELKINELDSYLDDNTTINKNIISDYYCINYSNLSSKVNQTFITSVSKDKVLKLTSKNGSESESPQYFRNVKFPVYKNLRRQSVKVTLGESVSRGNITMWVDWRKDNAFDNSTASTVITDKDELTYEVPFSLPENIANGTYNIRIRVMPNSDIVDPCSEEIGHYGETEDYTIEVMDSYPVSKDIAILDTSLTSDQGLSDSEPIRITLANQSSNEVTGFKLTYQINGGEVITETYNDVIAPFEEVRFTFSSNHAADLSKVGKYEVKISAILEGDENNENDVLVKTIYNAPKNEEGFYALDFDGKDDLLNLGTLLGSHNLRDCTYEAWINPESYGSFKNKEFGYGTIFTGKNATVYLNNKSADYPESCLVIESGDGVVHTGANTIDLGRWQHLALSFDSQSESWKVFIDGKPEVLTVVSPTTYMSDNENDDLLVGNSHDLSRAFEGMIDNIRIWNQAKSATDISNNMNKVLSLSSPSSEGLIAEFQISEGYFNDKVSSGFLEGTIQNADISASSTSIWKRPEVGFKIFKLKSQVIPFHNVADDVNHIITELTSSAKNMGKDIIS